MDKVKKQKEIAILRKQLSNKDYTINTLKLLNHELTVENEVLERVMEQIIETLARRN